MNLSVDHVTIIASDIEATRRFYVDVMGMDEVKRPSFDFAGAWFEKNGFQVHATLASVESGCAGPGDRGAEFVSRGQHLAFRVAEFEAAIKLLTSSGIEIAAGPKKRPDGISQAYFHDPDGYLIEICGMQTA